MPTWDPQRYLTYADERGRPFVDLIARIDAQPSSVVDLGCGPGNLTVLLTARWPQAQVSGVDGSAAMIARARADHPGATWVEADLREWRGEADVVVSNAALQWVPDHLALLPALAARAREWFAFQVPGNFEEPSHTIRAELERSEEYAAYTAGLEAPSSHDAATYLDALAADFEVDAWETTYLHRLHGEDAVLDWIAGTSLRPTKAALPDELWPGFEAELRRRLRLAYPARDGVVLMPFRRIFVVARRR